MKKFLLVGLFSVLVFSVVCVAVSESPGAKIEFVKKDLLSPAIASDFVSLAVPVFEKQVFVTATPKEIARKKVSPVARSRLRC